MKQFIRAIILLTSLCSVYSFADLPTFHSEIGSVALAQSRTWNKPDYSDQKDALGYQIGTFSVPAGMEERVSFWIDIYTKFTSSQGLLHDSQYVHLVYEKLDFADIDSNQVMTGYQKHREKEKRIKAAKKKVIQALHRLQKYNTPAGLEGDDLRYWYMFAKVDEPKKFLNATSNKRLRFQLGQRDHFINGIFQSGRYLREMELVFKEMQLPKELTRLPFVESSFNVKARSKVGASGIWQFMRYTARPYLKINQSVDERNDPMAATRAAAKLLRNNYMMLEDWPLAVTGYNHGPAGVRRLVRKFMTKNLVELLDVRKGRFGFASANFYASFLAALEVEKNADLHFGHVYWDLPIPHEPIRLTKNISHKQLIDWFDGDEKRAVEYNPHINHSVWKGRVSIATKSLIYVPDEYHKMALSELKEIKDVQLFHGTTYKVSQGDTLDEIAKNFGVRLNHLLAANEGINPRRLQVGQQIYIPSN